MTDLVARIVITGVNQSGAAVRGATKDFTSLGNQALATAAQLNQAAEAAGKLGRGARKILEGPIRATADFESAMSRVSALTQATGSDFDLLEGQARQLGETTMFTAQQSAEAMQFFGLAGFEATEIYEAMPGALNLAAAGAVDVATAADIASKQVRAFGLDASETARVSDVLAATFTSSNVTLQTLGDTMKFVAPVAKQAGLSLEETAAIAGVVGDAGIQGSLAGTALRMSLIKLSNPTKAARKEMKRLGVTALDASGELKRPAVLLGEFGQAVAELPGASKLKALSTVFGARAAPAVAVLLEATAGLEDGQNKLVTAIERNEAASEGQGRASEVAAIQMDNLKGSGIELQSAWESLKITMGDLVNEDLREIVIGLRDTVRETGAWLKQHPTVVKGLLTVTAAVGGLGIVLAPLFTTIATGAGIFGLTAKSIGFFTSSLGSAGAAAVQSAPAIGAVAAEATTLMGALGTIAGGAGGVLAAGAVGFGIGTLIDRVTGLSDAFGDLAGSLTDTGRAGAAAVKAAGGRATKRGLGKKEGPKQITTGGLTSMIVARAMAATPLGLIKAQQEAEAARVRVGETGAAKTEAEAAIAPATAAVSEAATEVQDFAGFAEEAKREFHNLQQASADGSITQEEVIAASNELVIAERDLVDAVLREDKVTNELAALKEKQQAARHAAFEAGVMAEALETRLKNVITIKLEGINRDQISSVSTEGDGESSVDVDAGLASGVN